MHPRGKFLPDPNAGDRLFPECGSKTCLLVPQAGHACQKMPEPSSPSACSHLLGFREWPHAPGLIRLWGKNPSRAWQDTSGCSKAPNGTPGNISASYFLWLLPLSWQGLRVASSAVLLKKIFLPWLCHCHPAERDWPPSDEFGSAPQEGIPLVVPPLSS